jgi:hypothetical protein
VREVDIVVKWFLLEQNECSIVSSQTASNCYGRQSLPVMKRTGCNTPVDWVKANKANTASPLQLEQCMLSTSPSQGEKTVLAIAGA